MKTTPPPIAVVSPIETYYKGIKFRSRLEARWAMFMDVLAVQWQYEPDAYTINGKGYLPDFYLPQQDCFLEIKPKEPTQEELEKASGLAQITGKPVFVLYGPIALSPIISTAIKYFPDVGEDEGYYWCECPHCFRVELQFGGRADRINCHCAKSVHGDKGYNFESPRLRRAYDTASGFRFEEWR